MLLPIILLLIPLAAVGFTASAKQWKHLSTATMAASVILFCAMVWYVISISTGALASNAWFINDQVSGIAVMLISTLFVAVSFYSHAYIGTEIEEGTVNLSRARQFYAFLNLFVASMIGAIIFDNIGLSWAGIEATTLSTALLVGMYRERTSLEAAWKYLMICSVGISIAFLGLLLLVMSASGADAASLFSWQMLRYGPVAFSPSLLKIAFSLLLIGYGTKVGLAPLHTWLPDAHGNAPSPISAMLSGVLLSVAFLVLARFKVIVDIGLGSSTLTNGLLFFFGFITILVAATSMLRQTSYKRLLAFSSMENMGLVAVGFGLGAPLAIIGSLLHIIYHALAKSFMFLSSGNIYLTYHTTKTAKVRGAIRIIPFTAVMVMLGVLAITGLPPFAIFSSKFMILQQLFAVHPVVATIIVVLLTMIFGSFVFYYGQMIYGEPPVTTEKGGVEHAVVPREKSLFSMIPLVVIISLLLILGVALPKGGLAFVTAAASILTK